MTDVELAEMRFRVFNQATIDVYQEWRSSLRKDQPTLKEIIERAEAMLGFIYK